MPAYTLPDLPYDVAALEPHYSAEVLALHHDKHHAAYVAGANATLDKLGEARDSDDYGSINMLQKNLAFHLSGHVLHSMFWENLSPDGGGRPDGNLAAAIEESFGGFDHFRSQLTQSALNVQGSGWGALTWEPLGQRLIVEQIYDHQSNVGQGAPPLLVLDMWEHAYYLQYRNVKADWVDAFWEIVNWPDVAARFERARTLELLYRAPGGTMTGQVLLAAGAAIVVLMGMTWILSLAWKDASIVDPVWPLGFVVVAWVTRGVADGNDARQWLIVVLVTVWGLRLSAYLAWRKRGAPEDHRYRAMRRHWGANFWIISLLTVFALQSTLMWIVSLPVQLGQVRAEPGLGVLAYLGTAIWLLGFVFESIGDAQLARFKVDPDHADQVMDRGLWRYTRHPNYFGDACVWWGIAIVAAETGIGAIGIVGAIVMTVLLVRVSGVPMLERTMAKRRPGYTEYVARTSVFIPRPPRRA